MRQAESSRDTVQQSAVYVVCRRLNLAIQNVHMPSIITTSATFGWNEVLYKVMRCVSEIMCEMCLVVRSFYAEVKESRVG